MTSQGQIRNSVQFEIHGQFADIAMGQVSSQTLNDYLSQNAIYHALATPVPSKAAKLIDQWLHEPHEHSQQQALVGLLLFLNYPQTVDKGFSILNQSDTRIRSILKQVVPLPLQSVAAIFSNLNETLDNIPWEEIISTSSEDIDHSEEFWSLILQTLKEFEKMIGFLAKVFAADLHNQLRQGHVVLPRKGKRPNPIIGLINKSLDPTLLGKMISFLELSKTPSFKPSLVALSNLPNEIRDNLASMINKVRRARNDIAHSGTIQKEMILSIIDTVWDLKLLLFCFCDWKIELTLIQTLGSENPIELYDAQLTHERCGKIPLWPFYLVIRKDGHEEWLELERSQWNNGIRTNDDGFICIQPLAQNLPENPKERRVFLKRMLFTRTAHEIGYGLV